MADITPYEAGDATDEDRLRHLRQQYHEAAEALRVSTPERTVERQRLSELEKAIERLETKITGATGNRMHTVYSKHSRAV